jgi:hypothetical protein
MPRYVVMRTFTVDGTQLPQVGRKSRTLIEGTFPSITWEHSHVTVGDDGTVRSFCIYAAPDEGTIRDHSDALGYHVVDAIHEIVDDVTPADFPAA